MDDRHHSPLISTESRPTLPSFPPPYLPPRHSVSFRLPSLDPIDAFTLLLPLSPSSLLPLLTAIRLHSAFKRLLLSLPASCHVFSSHAHRLFLSHPTLRFPLSLFEQRASRAAPRSSGHYAPSPCASASTTATASSPPHSATLEECLLSF
jgi:hypothetical protein